jgi:hypothetical protein
MSHTSTVDTKLTDVECIRKAAMNVGGRVLEGNSHQLYQGSYKGIGVQLKGWRYPIVINEEGAISMDNYNGNWGKNEELDSFKQQYSIEAVNKALRQRRMNGTQVVNSDGTVTIRVKVAV